MAVFAEGIVFIALSLTNVREAIFNAIPSTLKKGVSAGIGIFIAFVGLQGAHIIVNSDSTLLTYVNFRGNFHTLGICALLALIGLMITAILYVKNVKGSILLGILITWILGMICQATNIYTVDVENGFYSLYPTFALTDFTAIGKTFGQCFKVDFKGVSIANFVVVLLSFLFVDIFDTIGTLVGVSTKADMLDKDSSHQAGTSCRCDRYDSRCSIRYFYNNHFRRKFSRCWCRCKNRSGFCSNRSVIPGCHSLCSYFHRNPGICYSSCTDLCRIPDGIFCSKD